MPTLPWNDDLFLSEVRPHLPGCPVPVMAKAVLESARKFFEHSKSWRHKTQVESEAGVDVYPLDLPPQAEAAHMLKTSFLDVFLRRPDELVFTKPPTQAGFLVCLDLACMPSRDSEGMDEALAGQWLEGIAAGALAKLMMEPNFQWSNPAMALLHAKTAKREQGKALIWASRKGQAVSESYSVGGALT